MRNETMKDRLSSVFRETQTHGAETTTPVLRAHSGAKRKGKIIQPIPLRSKGNSVEGQVLGPRYVTPPRRSNPFTHHAFSSAPVYAPPQLEARIEPEPEIQLPEVSPDELEVPEIAAPEEMEQPVEIKETAEASHLSESVPCQQAEPQRGPSLVPPSAPIEDAPTVNLPPNLAWLKKETPFAANLTGIVDNLRDARQTVIFALKEHETRAQGFQKQLEVEQWGIEVERENLRILDNTISACALVAEQSAGIDPALLGRNGNHRKASNAAPVQRRAYQPTKDDPSVFRVADARKFFAENPGTNWTAAEIIPNIPAAKRTHAKTSLPAILSSLAEYGDIARIGRGVFRALGT